MINAVNQINTGVLQKVGTNNSFKNLSEGQSLQEASQGSRFDTLELSDEAISANPRLNVQSQVKIEKPRSWSIAIQTMDSHINQVENSIKKADNMNLSFGDRLTFLKNEGINWAQDIKQKDPEMFVEWLTMNKENIEAGRADLASLPSDFTMEDYYSYVNA